MHNATEVRRRHKCVAMHDCITHLFNLAYRLCIDAHPSNDHCIEIEKGPRVQCIQAVHLQNPVTTSNVCKLASLLSKAVADQCQDPHLVFKL